MGLRDDVKKRNAALKKAAGSGLPTPKKKPRNHISQFSDEEMADMTMERYKKLDFGS